MQNAKDTFYRMLQSRLAALNPARTIVLRGTVRPGVLVEENELATAALCRGHVSAGLDRAAHRRRARSAAGHNAMRHPLCHRRNLRQRRNGPRPRALRDGCRSWPPPSAPLRSPSPKQSFVGLPAGVPPITMATNIVWADPVFGPCEIKGERLARTATVQVLAYREAGEL